MNREHAGSSDGAVENRPETVEAFTNLFNEFPVRDLVGNLSTDVRRLVCADQHFPITLNDATQAPNCYICSPSSAYIDYAIDETRNFQSTPLVKRLITLLIKACMPLVRMSGLDHQVQLNNWLFSTNPVPHLDAKAAIAIRDELTKLHPDRAVVVRSLNDVADVKTIEAFRSAGFQMLAARQIYIFADRSQTPRLTINMRRDRKLLKNTRFIRVENDGFLPSDYGRCEQLYTMLYLQKYTPLNPHYTALYIGEMHKRGILKLAGFRDASGHLVAVTGLFENGQTLTQPIVGYDTTLPVEFGLYRLVMTLSQVHASRNGLFFNMSAGAANFKRLRGAVPSIEYTAVYVAHLRFHQRLAVRIMAAVLNRVGIPLLRRFEL